ncbi:heterokaryon incompatibility protein-domain-containing protein [Xylariaceae sp. AK1471]|nr:heterokaryon incompatibility protein-domain-containing protein [Xylariaceae sp. AK1471]
MWLIDTHTLELKFFAEAKKGSYAILSHTWEEEEVSFEQFRNLDPTHRDKVRCQKGFAKIAKTCELASQEGLSYAWVDTCCIDKFSSAELSEAINSMFKYYQDAAFCITFISDLPRAFDRFGHDLDFWGLFHFCRWLTRGWTLQELVAPSIVMFYDATWTLRGSKSVWKSLLSKETGVDVAILDDPRGLPFVPVGRRMSWASKRETTRTEDMAYCLLGIFNVNLPMIYGEGQKAFMRLQEEIAKDSCDLSLFAWQQLDTSQDYQGIMASSVSDFSNCRGLKHRIKNTVLSNEFALTNRGLRTETTLVSIPYVSEDLVWNLGCSFRDDWPTHTSEGWIGVYLAKTQNGYVRARPSELFQAAEFEVRDRCKPALIYIRKTVDFWESLVVKRRFEGAIKVELPKPLRPLYATDGHSPNTIRKPLCSSYTIDGLAPSALWDETRALFLHQGQGINAYIHLTINLLNQAPVSIIVACSTMDTPVCAIWESSNPLMHDVHNFMKANTELADFVAADYLRLNFLCQENDPNSFIPISAELKEQTIWNGQTRFVLCIDLP